MRRWPMFVALLASSAGAQAGDKPLYAPVPGWVKPAPAIDATALKDDSPVVLMLDTQQKLEGGQVWSYYDTATRAATQEALSSIGNLQLPWQPSQGNLLIHTAEIVRGATRIDLVKGGNPFTVLRREEQMNQRMLDGRLTATLPVEGLQVGDVLHVAFSVTRTDATLKGDLQTYAPLIFDPFRVQFARARLLWPAASDVRWKVYADGVAVQPVALGGYKELTVTMPLAKAAEIPSDAPQRFQKLPILEATSFADWAAVSKAMAPLYATEGLIAPGSPLAAEVDRIRAADSEPLKRAALSLSLVQDKVRYLLLGMDTGNYVPQTPAQTWSLRYGDCKAKTLLLLAILHALGIEAEAVVANTKLGDLVPERLPGAAAFDHVLVRATIGGETLWLDGTGSGARLADIRDTPPLGSVLPLRAAGAALLPIPLRAAARPEIAATIDFDERAGVSLPAGFTGTITLRGDFVETIRLGNAQGSKEDIDKFVGSLFKSYVGDAAMIVERAIAFDDAAGVVTVTATGVAYPDWRRENSKIRRSLDKLVADITFDPDRARPAWRAIPVKIVGPGHMSVRTRVRLPRGGAGFTLEGAPTLSETLAGQTIERKTSLAGEWVTLEDRLLSAGGEIAVSDIPAVRRKLSVAKTNLPRIVAPADYPATWEDIVVGKREKRFDPLLALYTKRIAKAPDDRDGYTDRAWFLERIYDRKAAIADLDKAITIEPQADTYLKRASLRSELGEDDKALADAVSAYALDPASDDAIGRLAFLKAERGEHAAALELLQERIDQAGKDKPDYLDSKANVQARIGDKDGAIETIDAAIAGRPGDPDLLNSRCWIKGTMNVALDTALKDCTKAIELSDNPAAVLDSRAMVYFRLGRMEDATVDLDSALAAAPDLPASLYLRGVIRKRGGQAAAGDRDLAAARILSPQIDRAYKRYGITP